MSDSRTAEQIRHDEACAKHAAPGSRPRASVATEHGRIRIHNRDVYAWAPSGVWPANLIVKTRKTRSAPKGEDLVLAHKAGDPLRRVTPLTRQGWESLVRAREWRKVEAQWARARQEVPQ